MEYDDSNNEDPGKLDKDAEKEIKRVRDYLQGNQFYLFAILYITHA